MPDNIGVFGQAQEQQAAKAQLAEMTSPLAVPAAVQTYGDDELLAFWKDFKKECFDGRTVFERQWMRNLYYVLNRQWIQWYPREGRWKDKPLGKGIPKPVTNKCKETIQTIRAMFAAIKLGANIRPNGADPKNVSAAATADDLQPVLYEAHDMDNVLKEFDFWLLATGNAFMHCYIDYDLKHGADVLTAEQCAACGAVHPSAELAETNACPDCGGTEFTPALDPETGQLIQQVEPKGRPATTAFSPLEIAFPNSYGRFSDIPGLVRLRWRSKRYYMGHPQLKEQLADFAWSKSANDQSLQMYKSLANHNDLGIAGGYYEDVASESQDEGAPEYEIWLKPTVDYPGGLVFRVVGDGEGARVLRLEETEALPGPLPYRDADGQPLFTFTHAGYDHVGGRIWASGALDPLIGKQDDLNRLDSMILLIIQRMSNPVWLEPKGAEIERFTGMPGLVIKWNPLTVGGNAKPERIPGEGPHQSLFQIREQYLKDIEELAGTFDILKGEKPSGVEAFSAMQLLVERSQARFAAVFAARGNAFKDQVKFALELEREFGPDERTKATLSPARQWTFENFKKANLSGSFSVVIEDGSAVPKTSLGMRAAIDHANMLQMINMQDPDQQYEGLKLFGLTKMVPTLDINMQAALQKQQAFEDWVQDPAAVQAGLQQSVQATQTFVAEQQQAPVPMADPATGALPPVATPPSPLNFTPLKWRRWYNAAIHRQEFLKWANSDRIRELLEGDKGEFIEQLLDAHLQEIEMAFAEQAMFAMGGAPLGAPAGGNGSGAGMGNSNRESNFGNEPNGPGQPKA